MLLDLITGKKKITTNEPVEIIQLKSVDSTNEYLKRDVDDGRIKICLAEQQTEGKGRLNRTWYSPMGENIYLSCRYPFKKQADDLSGLSLVVGLTIFNVLQQSNITQNLAVKWPNDIVCGEKKLAGVLIELQKSKDGLTYAIIGVGINANMVDDQHAITQPWTSMKQVLQQDVDRKLITDTLVARLLENLKKFDEQGFLPFVEDWKKVDSLLGKHIQVLNAGVVIEGEALGVDLHGQLLLRMADGSTRALLAGETSVVKN